MTIDKSILSLGQYLRAVRQEKDISLETIAIETCISADVLRAIEKEEYDRLPAEVYVKGFLRAYARVVGVDGDDVIKRYLALQQDEAETGGGGFEKPRFIQRKWLQVILVLIGFAALIWGAIYIMSNHDGDQKPEQTLKAPAKTEKPVPPKVEEEAQKRPPKEAPPKKEETQKKALKHNLKVHAIEKTWLKVIADGGQPKVYQLKPGDEIELSASTDFNLLIGNAGGVRLTLNQQAVAVPGKSGQVVTLQLP